MAHALHQHRLSAAASPLRCAGKTTSVMCLAREMLGPLVADAVLELNASDARGIDVVRNMIKAFAQQKVTLPPGRHKIVILVSQHR